MFSRAVRAFKGAGDDEQFIEKTYPKIDVKNGFNAEKNFDRRRNKVNDELKLQARIMARDYLKAHNVDAPSLKEYSGTNEDVLDKVAYASLVDYSFKTNDTGTEVVKQPPEQKGPLPINTLSKLVGGWFADGRGSDVVGGFHKLGSEIGDEKVTVKFRFNFEKSINNKDLLIWQGKLPATPPPIPPPVVANTNDKLIKIKEAGRYRMTLADNRMFEPFPNLRIYYTNLVGSASLLWMDIEKQDLHPILPTLERYYVDPDEISAVQMWKGTALPDPPNLLPTERVFGGRKSTRRRQRRSNTHRRIKQRKQSRKNHTRRRKSIRK